MDQWISGVCHRRSLADQEHLSNTGLPVDGASWNTIMVMNGIVKIKVILGASVYI